MQHQVNSISQLSRWNKNQAKHHKWQNCLHFYQARQPRIKNKGTFNKIAKFAKVEIDWENIECDLEGGRKTNKLKSTTFYGTKSTHHVWYWDVETWAHVFRK